MNNTRVYLYKSATTGEEMRGQELTKYLLLPDIWTDNLDDTLDTAEIVLEGLPFREEFPPTTKFIIDKGSWQYNDNGVAASFDISETFHWVVENDTVTQPILSDDAYFRHTISLIEPAVIMQHRLCDNMAVTYQLKDITLDHPPVIDVTNKVYLSIINDVRDTLSPYPYGAYRQYVAGRTEGGDEEWNDYYTIGHRFEWIMPDWYTYVDKSGNRVIPSWTAWRNIPANIPTEEPYRLVLPLPLLKCSYGLGNTFIKNGYCSYNVTVERASLGSTVWETVPSMSNIRVNPTNAYSQEAWTSDGYQDGTEFQGNVTGQGWIVGSLTGVVEVKNIRYIINPTKVAEFDNTVGTRVLDITLDPNYSYRISLIRNVFMQASINGSGLSYGGKYLAVPYGVSRVGLYWKYQWYAAANRQLRELTPYNVDILGDLGVSTVLNVPFQTNSTQKIVTSAPPVSAYYLFNKAQMATFPHLYTDEVNVGQMSEQTVENVEPATFFVAPRVIDKLKNTTIVENFYYQKNFWEMAMEVGRYIHGRPKAYFAPNDRLGVDFKEYGKTDIQQENNVTKISVYNSRFIEEYLSQVSSYVNNLVQIGGTITEYIVAKSADDTFTVSNDNCVLQTTYPIIEIVDMQCKDISVSGSNWCSMVGKNIFDDGSKGSGFVFGKPVYDILPITLTDEQNQPNNVNKGVALYYELGDNQIVGCQFRLPTVNSGEPENDYAIKKVLYRATNDKGTPMTIDALSKVQINNYIFKITYRTKDSLRVDQFRPDLRKYLLNGGKDSIPRHAQFYNQQDVLVDSGAFGNHVYGRLIRTGNEVYTVKEWVSEFSNLKKAGELYRIYGNLYYVSKVTHTQYTDHYESEVEFSKDFNRLTEIIGIPSEPRFNPISERSLIDREIAPTEFLYLTTQNDVEDLPITGENRLTLVGLNNIKNILFGDTNNSGTVGIYPKYARVHFFNDPLLGADALPLGTLKNNGEPLETDEDGNILNPEGVWVFLPLSCYASQNSLVCEWDTVDNLSAGDQVLTTDNSPSDVATAYRILSPIQYCDASGRVDLVEMEIWTQLPLQDDQIAQLPSGYIFGNNISSQTANNSWSSKETYIVLKDNRERLAMNKTYSLITDSDRFVTSAWLWEQEKGTTYIALGLDEVTKIIVDVIPADMLMYDTDGTTLTLDYAVSIGSYIGISEYLTIKIQDAIENYLATHFQPASGSTDKYNREQAEAFMSNVKSIILCGGQPVVPEQSVQTANYFIMARNVGDLTFEEKITDWFIFEGKPKFKTQPDISL